jgi:hypothetical protein
VFRGLCGGVCSLTLLLAIVLAGCGKPSGAAHTSSSPTQSSLEDPRMYSEMRAYGFVWTDARSPRDAHGRPRVYPVSQLGKPGVPQLDDVMIAQIRDVTAAIKARYRPLLSFALIDEYPRFRYLAVFLAGRPQYPVVNLCYPMPPCIHDCPRYFDPIGRSVHVSTMPACADALPIWV